MSEAVHTAERLAELQSLPLERKIMITQTRIIEWYKHYNGKVCVSFSGGKDSTVLLHIARQIYPDIPAVFSNTGLEYPEIQRFARSFDNVDFVTPSMRFTDVIEQYGYPLIGKEVAEAIYYARRIRPAAERERERRSLNHINTSSAANRRTVLTGQMPLYTHTHNAATGNASGSESSYPAKETRVAGLQTNWKRLEIGGGIKPGLSREEQRKSTDAGTIWRGSIRENRGRTDKSCKGRTAEPG